MGRKRIGEEFGKTNHVEWLECPHCNGTGKIAAASETIGDRFKLCRNKDGRTQEQLCTILHLTRSGLANIESNRVRPGLDTLVSAADVYAVSVDYLLGRRGKK